MIFQKFSLFLFSLILLASVASASLSLTASPQTINVNPGTTASLTLLVNNTADAMTGLVWSSTPSIDLSSLSSTVAQTSTLSTILNYAVPSTAKGQTNITVSVSNSTGSIASTKFILNIASVSTLTITKVTELTTTQSGKVTVTNTGNSDLNVVMSSGSNAVLGFSPSAFTLTAGDSKDVIVTSQDLSNLGFGESVTVTASASGVSSQSVSFNSVVKGFCSNGLAGKNISIKNIDISSSGKDDNEWKFLDTVTVEVEVEDIGNDDINEVQVELGLFDSSGSNVIGDLDFINSDEETFDIGDLSDGDEETATFEFLVPADVDAGSYKLAVKVYSDDTGESLDCDDTSSDLSNTNYESVKIKEETDDGKYIGFDNIVISPKEATCSESVTLSFDAYNVGEKDQDRVRVNLQDSKLELDQSYEIRNMDKGDKSRVSFTFDVPSNAQDGLYKLSLSSDYKYRNGDYDLSSEDDTVVTLNVAGCKEVVNPSTSGAQINAVLDGDAKAGEEITVSATVRNTGSASATYLINVKGYEDWADLSSISDRSLTLGAGQSDTVVMNFKANSDSAGEQTFVIEAISNGKTESREVSLNVEGSSSAGLSGIFKGNSLAWLIGLINVVLIVLIIVIAIKVARK